MLSAGKSGPRSNRSVAPGPGQLVLRVRDSRLRGQDDELDAVAGAEFVRIRDTWVLAVQGLSPLDIRSVYSLTPSRDADPPMRGSAAQEAGGRAEVKLVRLAGS